MRKFLPSSISFLALIVTLAFVGVIVGLSTDSAQAKGAAPAGKSEVATGQYTCSTSKEGTDVFSGIKVQVSASAGICSFVRCIDLFMPLKGTPLDCDAEAVAVRTAVQAAAGCTAGPIAPDISVSLVERRFGFFCFGPKEQVLTTMDAILAAAAAGL